MAYMCMCFKFHWYDIVCMLFFTVLCLWFNLFSLAMYNSGLQCNRLVHYCLLESMPKMKHWCQFLIICNGDENDNNTKEGRGELGVHDRVSEVEHVMALPPPLDWAIEWGVTTPLFVLPEFDKNPKQQHHWVWIWIWVSKFFLW